MNVKNQIKLQQNYSNQIKTNLLIIYKLKQSYFKLKYKSRRTTMALILVGNYMLAVTYYILSLTIIQLLYHLVGCYYLVLFVRFLFFTIWNIIKQFIPLNDILKKYSHLSKDQNQCWAVITGATDGIGLGFAQVLTQLGFDICLISRNQQKLTKTVQNLKKFRPQKFHKRKFMTVQFDYQNSANQEKFRQMIDKIRNLDIGILVNNVGTSEPNKFEDYSYNTIKDIFNINCTSMAVMTRQLLPLLKKRKNRSAIINLSSFAGQNPVPYVALYAATKSMNTFFSQAIAIQNPQIDILSVRPMFVQSPLSRQKKGFNVPDRRECALASLKQLRWQNQTNGYILHRIFAKFNQLFVPQFLFRIASEKAARSLIKSYNDKKD